MRRKGVRGWIMGAAAAAALMAGAPLPRTQERGEALAFASAPRAEAKDFVGLLANWNFVYAMNELSDGFRKQTTPERLQASWETLVRQFGRYLTREVTSVEFDGGRWVIHVLVTFQKGYVDAVVYFNAMAGDKKVTGFRFAKVTREQPIG